MTHDDTTNMTTSERKPGKQGRGRPSTAVRFKIVPVPREELDLAALGRAFLALAVHQAPVQNEAAPRPEGHDGKA